MQIQYLSIQPICLQILRRQCCLNKFVNSIGIHFFMSVYGRITFCHLTSVRLPATWAPVTHLQQTWGGRLARWPPFVFIADSAQTEYYSTFRVSVSVQAWHLNFSQLFDDLGHENHLFSEAYHPGWPPAPWPLFPPDHLTNWPPGPPWLAWTWTSHVPDHLQYIGVPKIYFQYSGREWWEKVLIKPGFVCQVRAYQLD